MDARGPDLRAAIGAAGGRFSAPLGSAGGRSSASRGHFFPVGVATHPGEEAIDRLRFLSTSA
eukprot:14876190-Alexandrium_andersonii.AAC.1